MRPMIILALACLSVALTEAGIAELPGHLYVHRERLGHFKVEPFSDLYKAYATALVNNKLSPKLDEDDYRNYLPPGYSCVNYLTQLRINEYVVQNIEEFVLLDACLGYVFDSEYHDEDKEAFPLVRENLDSFKADEVLSKLYHETNVNQFPEEAKDCIGDLMLNAISVKKQFPDKTCNNHHLEVFLEFARCQQTIPAEAREGDSYAARIYDLVKRRAKQCFDHEINELNVAVRSEYANNPFERFRNAVSLDKLRKQQYKRMTPTTIKNLLAAVQGTTSEISLRVVHEIVMRVSENNPVVKKRLLNNMADFANKKIKPGNDKKAMASDPTGSIRYRDLVDNLCNFFRPSDNANYYDFATPFIRMVSLLQYPDILGVTKDYFKKNILIRGNEITELYLSVSSCNILTFTQAAFETKPENHKPNYLVSFAPDTSKMIIWPNAGYI